MPRRYTQEKSTEESIQEFIRGVLVGFLACITIAGLLYVIDRMYGHSLRDEVYIDGDPPPLSSYEDDFSLYIDEVE